LATAEWLPRSTLFHTAGGRSGYQRTGALPVGARTGHRLFKQAGVLAGEFSCRFNQSSVHPITADQRVSARLERVLVLGRHWAWRNRAAFVRAKSARP